MLAGHYAAAFAGKAIEPKLPLWLLFAAALLVDMLWAVLVLCGIEKAEIQPGLPSNPLVATFMPYSHSLYGNAVVAVFVWFAVWRVWDALRKVAVVAAVVLSHWFFDLLVHRPDLTLAGSDPKLGWGLWNHPWLANSLEFGLLLGCFAVFWVLACATYRQKRAALISLLLLLAVQVYSICSKPPTTLLSLLLPLLGFWLAMPLLAFWLERLGQRVAPKPQPTALQKPAAS
jgi:hypothetical protein